MRTPVTNIRLANWKFPWIDASKKVHLPFQDHSKKIFKRYINFRPKDAAIRYLRLPKKKMHHITYWDQKDRPISERNRWISWLAKCQPLHLSQLQFVSACWFGCRHYNVKKARWLEEYQCGREDFFIFMCFAMVTMYTTSLLIHIAF